MAEVEMQTKVEFKIDIFISEKDIRESLSFYILYINILIPLQSKKVKRK